MTKRVPVTFDPKVTGTHITRCDNSLNTYLKYPILSPLIFQKNMTIGDDL